MEIVDQILSFLATAYGKQPDRLRSLEKQAIAVLVAAATSRFAPRVSQRVIVNRLTIAIGRYVSRHPLAAVTSYWIASSRNAGIRPQWLGPYTQEIEAAAGVPIVANAGRILPVVGRAVAPLFSERVVQGARTASSELSNLRAPQLVRTLFNSRAARWIGSTIAQRYPQILNNPATRGFFGYLSRHPAAALGAYYAGGYIDATYRPQFLGYYTREIITAGLFPTFAYAPQAVPPLIRWAGSAAYYGSRGLANTVQWLTIRPAAANVAASAPLLDRVLFSLISRLPPHRQDLFLSWYERWVTIRRSQQLEIARGLMSSGGIKSPREAMQLAGKLLAESERYIASVWGRIGYHIWLRRKYPRLWPIITPSLSTRQRVVLGAAVGGTISILGWIVGGEAGYHWWATGELPHWYQWPFIVPLTGEITGAAIAAGRPGVAAVLHHAGAKLRWAASPLLQGASALRPALQSASVWLRLPQAANLLARSAPVFRGGASLARMGIGAAGRGLGAITRIAGGNAASLGFFSVEAYEELARLYGRAEIVTELRDAIEGRLRNMEEWERQGYRWAMPVAQMRQRIFENLIRRQDLTDIRFLAGHLEALSNWDDTARHELQARQTVGVLQSSLTVAESSITALEQISENVGQLAQRFQGAGFAISAAQRTRRGQGQRDAHGWLWRLQVPYIAPLPPLPISFDQALAYINRRAAEAARIMLASATTGIPIQPAVPGGLLGQPPPGKGREFWLYRGRDRRLILQTLRDMQTIVLRDRFAETGKKTTQLSNREPIFGDNNPGLEGAVIVVIRALKRAASLVRNRGPLGGFHSINEGD